MKAKKRKAKKPIYIEAFGLRFCVAGGRGRPVVLGRSRSRGCGCLVSRKKEP